MNLVVDLGLFLHSIKSPAFAEFTRFLNSDLVLPAANTIKKRLHDYAENITRNSLQRRPPTSQIAISWNEWTTPGLSHHFTGLYIHFIDGN
jgi:hypothetical protein